MDYPAFAYPSKFAEISGLPVKQVRELCAQQIIPNERTRRGFRVDVCSAMEVLQNRAATFAGHTKRMPRQAIISVPRRSGRRATDILAAIDAL